MEKKERRTFMDSLKATILQYIDRKGLLLLSQALVLKDSSHNTESTATLRIEAEVDDKVFETFDRLEAAIVRIKHELLEVKRLSRETGIDPKLIMSPKS
jgi:uncharacterized protein YaaW (UPF0174 family)